MFSLSYHYTMLLPFNITGDNAPVQSWVFFVQEILTFLYYANEKSCDIINCFTKTVKYKQNRKIEARISLEIFERCFSNVAPEMYMTKETGCNPLSYCQNNTLGSSLFLSKTKYPH